MNVVHCESARCYLSRESDGCTVYAWAPGKCESHDGKFSLDDGRYLGSCNVNKPFSRIQQESITRFIVAQNDFIREQFETDYFTKPDHFRELNPAQAADLLGVYQPHYPHWRVSAQLFSAMQENPAYRWNRDFFNHAVSAPISDTAIAEYRDQILRDTWEQYFAIDSTYETFLSETAEREAQFGPVPKSSRVWSIDEVEFLYLHRFHCDQDSASAAEYVWWEDGKTYHLNEIIQDAGSGQIPYLLP